MITYNLGNNVTAFTTTKQYGRDADLLCPALGVPTERFARPHQVHKTEVYQITEDFFRIENSPFAFRLSSLEGIDAVIYDVRNACIGISTADCIPVVCYDPEHHAAAAIHAGWKGTVARIVVKTIEKMQQAYDTDPSKLRCAIGPGISLDSFEVGDEVYDKFKEAGFPMEEIARRYPVLGSKVEGLGSKVEGLSSLDSRLSSKSSRLSSKTLEKWHIDLKHCNELQLLSLGVKQENIEVSPLDTMTDERFYSARREGAKTGRILSGIVLR